MKNVRKGAKTINQIVAVGRKCTRLKKTAAMVISKSGSVRVNVGAILQSGRRTFSVDFLCFCRSFCPIFLMFFLRVLAFKEAKRNTPLYDCATERRTVNAER
jgi:hypothetical protein